MAKIKLTHVCPACGSTETAKVEWSGQIGRDGADEYSGWWIECLACGLQGPKTVWDRMAKRRDEIQRALGTSVVVNERDQKYLMLIEGFGQKMFRELKSNDQKKGDFTNWKPKRDEALSELEHHFVKLTAAISKENRHSVSESSADLGNVIMAIDTTLGAK